MPSDHKLQGIIIWDVYEFSLIILVYFLMAQWNKDAIERQILMTC
jgi:hypothetical protein